MNARQQTAPSYRSEKCHPAECACGRCEAAASSQADIDPLTMPDWYRGSSSLSTSARTIPSTDDNELLGGFAGSPAVSFVEFGHCGLARCD
jgi:hypothetical protein